MTIACTTKECLTLFHEASTQGHPRFRSLRFMPRTAPFDLFETKNKRNDIRSHVGLALIMGDCDELMAQWLNFVKGVVDSDGQFVRIL